MATFIPEVWINDYATEIDGRIEFDVTDQLLLRGPDYLDNLRDNSYPTDDLAECLLARQKHDGPFRVEIKEPALAFIYADENEAGARERQAGESENLDPRAGMQDLGL